MRPSIIHLLVTSLPVVRPAAGLVERLILLEHDDVGRGGVIVWLPVVLLSEVLALDIAERFEVGTGCTLVQALRRELPDLGIFVKFY